MITILMLVFSVIGIYACMCWVSNPVEMTVWGFAVKIMECLGLLSHMGIFLIITFR